MRPVSRQVRFRDRIDEKEEASTKHKCRKGSNIKHKCFFRCSRYHGCSLLVPSHVRLSSFLSLPLSFSLSLLTTSDEIALADSLLLDRLDCSSLASVTLDFIIP